MPNKITKASVHRLRSILARRTLYDHAGNKGRFPVDKLVAKGTTARMKSFEELAALESRPSQYNPDAEIPEKSWAYRILKHYFFNDFGAYTKHYSKENWKSPFGESEPSERGIGETTPA